MADAKWIPDLHGDMAVTEAARRALTLRLEAVRQRLPLAVEQADADIEHVHQFRVATRRAAAALRIFAELLPARLHGRTRKILRRLRRAAGAARDWDVLRAALTARLARTSGKERHGLDLLVGYAHGQRACAQEALTATAAAGACLAELVQELTCVLGDRGDHKGKLRDLAVPTLTELLQALEHAASQDPSAYAELHQVRILGKRLRYAMEVFESCFAPTFREQYYLAVEEMQEILGQANDSRVAADRLRELRAHLLRVQPEQWPAYAPGIERVLHYHERRLPQQRRAFARWWRHWQECGAERALAELILKAD